MNSSEYYREYRQKCGEEAAYDKRLRRLKEVQKGLEETAQEGSGAVSHSLGALGEALSKVFVTALDLSLRHRRRQRAKREIRQKTLC